jgi:hypothetical protein
MRQTVVQTTTIGTFVLRFWRETSTGKVRWRGRIEHVQSGESLAFLEFEAMLNFLRHFGILEGDQNQPGFEDG